MSPSAPTSPARATTTTTSSPWLELWADPQHPGQRNLLPGYSQIFGMGDGTVNGLGILNTSDAFGKVDYADLLKRG